MSAIVLPLRISNEIPIMYAFVIVCDAKDALRNATDVDCIDDGAPFPYFQFASFLLIICLVPLKH